MDGSVVQCPAALQGWSGAMIMNIVNTIMVTQCALNQENVYPENIASTLEDGDTFDFIVVGAGSAGSVVSNRLSENKNWKILVVEAGGIPSINTEIPAMYTNLKSTEEDWQFETERSDAACLAMKNERCKISKGKVLGGTSTINPMMYMRGTKNDYDSWSKKGNGNGWEYSSLNKYFLKSENLTAATVKNKRNHGHNGYMPVTRCNRTDNLKNKIAKAADELGYRWSDDETNSGYFDSLFTIDNGTRSSAAKAFLSRLKYRDNLNLALNARVVKIVVDRRTKTATGIEVRVNDRTVNLKARKEVILSAGTVNSAKLLMQSGIGPREHLDEVGVDLIKDADVGKNFKVNLMFPGYLVKIDEDVLDERDGNDDFYEYFVHRRGELGSIGLSELVGLVGKDQNNPDVQLFHFLFRKNQSDAIEEFFKDYKEEVRYSLRNLVAKSNLVLFAPMLLRPKSSGRIFLRSDDPLDKPVIRGGFLEDEDDLDVFLEAVKYLDKLLKTRSLSKYNPEVVRIELPGCERNRFKSDEFWRCAVREMATSFYSASGTCRMGAEDDRRAVVSPNLKINGITRLRVVDGSIKPNPAGTTHVPSVMIGEKGAEIIKRDWNYIRNNFAFVNNDWSNGYQGNQQNQQNHDNQNKKENNLNNLNYLMNYLLRYQY